MLKVVNKKCRYIVIKCIREYNKRLSTLRRSDLPFTLTTIFIYTMKMVLKKQAGEMIYVLSYVCSN